MGYTEKQLKILSTAEQLFATRGFDGTSVRDIAEASDVNVAMISYYFGSKEKLLQAIFRSRTETLSEKIEALLKDDSLTPLQKMEFVIDDYIDRIVEKQKFYKLMLAEHSMGNNVTISTLIRDMKMKNSQLISKLIKDGQDKKVFKKGIDVILLINTVFGTAIHTFIGAEFYVEYYGIKTNSEAELHALIKKKLNTHIKELCKAILLV